MAVADYAIISLVEAKNQLDIDTSDTGDDTVLTYFIDRASAFVESYTGRKIVTQSISEEIRDGDGTPFIYPRYFPIQQISVQDNPSEAQKLASVQYRVLPTDATWTDLETDSDYILYDTFKPYIQLYTQVFPRGVKNIRLEYKAGFASGSVELNDIKQVVSEMVQKAWADHRGGDNSLAYQSRSEASQGGGSMSWSYKDLKKEWKEVLDRYRLRRV